MIKKTLITVAELKALAERGQKVICLDRNVIVTPAAQDEAAVYGIKLLDERVKAGEKEVFSPPGSGCAGEALPKKREFAADPELIARIVKEVLALLPRQQCSPQMVTECDPSGLQLIKGNSLVYESYETGKPGDQVGIKQVVAAGEGSNLSAGFLTLERTSFTKELKDEETSYIVEGTLDVCLNGRRYRGKAGDVFYLPPKCQVTFSTPEQAKFFFVAYSAGRAADQDKQ